ncbi:MAG: helix-turn-helix transcriptional regulator [Acidimicrobiales bacterium]|jgi:DNA-binding phage protein
MAETRRSVFWDDLDSDLKDPEFRRQFVLEQNRIATTDRIMNLLIDALEESGLTRAAVARAVDSHASAIRRLLNRESKGTNPTLETLSDVAAVLGFQVALVPMGAQARRKVTNPLVSAAKPPSPRLRKQPSRPNLCVA